jgi:hypothetical protein
MEHKTIVPIGKRERFAEKRFFHPQQAITMRV